MEQNSKRDAMVTLAVLLVVVLIVAAAVVSAKKKSDNPAVTGGNAASSESASSPRDTTLPQGTSSTDTKNSTNATYQDGTYSATGQYGTPDGSETITVKVTLKDGAVTDTSAQGSMQSRESREYVTAFLGGYKSHVVGKSIAELSLSRLSGSSLTSQGFNSAIEQIRTQAQS